MELAVLDVLFRLPIFLVERFTILVESSRFDVMFSSRLLDSLEFERLKQNLGSCRFLKTLG